MLWQQFLSGAGLAGGLGLFGLLGSVAVAQGPAVASLAPGTVLFTEDFEDQDVARRWGKSAKLAEGHESAHALGFELAAQGKDTEAMEHFAAALRAKPDMSEAHLNMGVALAKKQRFAEAIGQFQEVLRIDPADAQARKYLEAARRLRSQNQ